MPNKIKLSVAIATYNEESNIVNCLKSVSKIADEMIVVDGTSTDKTVSLAKKNGAKVYVTTNKPIFHINKNIAIKKCRGDWILQLDADENLSPEMVTEIGQVINSGFTGFVDWKGRQPWPKNETPPVAFWLKRKNYFLGKAFKKTAQYPDPVIRLFRRNMAKLPAKDVHEQMVVKGKVAYLKSDLNHYGNQTFSTYLLRENRYSSLQAQLLKEKGYKPSVKNFIQFMIVKPAQTFFLLYLRHRGFIDGFPGFIFSLFSSIHHQLTYLKLWELTKDRRDLNLASDWN